MIVSCFVFHLTTVALPIGTKQETACGEMWQGYETTLMTHIRHLREKIEKNPSSPVSLLTVKGLGYKLLVKGVK